MGRETHHRFVVRVRFISRDLGAGPQRVTRETKAFAGGTAVWNVLVRNDLWTVFVRDNMGQVKQGRTTPVLYGRWNVIRVQVDARNSCWANGKKLHHGGIALPRFSITAKKCPMVVGGFYLEGK